MLPEVLPDRLHRFRGAVEGRKRFHRLAVLDQLEDAKKPDRPGQADRGVFLFERLMVTLHQRAHPPGVPNHVVFLVGADGAERRGAGQRVAVVGEPAIEHVLLEVRGDLRPHPDGAERNVAAGQPFGHGDQVGDDLPMVDRKPRTRAAEPRHDLVADHQDPVAIAQLADALEVTIGGDQDAVGTGHGLEEEGRNRIRAFQLDRLLEVLERLRRRVHLALGPVIRIEDVHHTGCPQVAGPPPGVPRQRHCARGRSVIRAVPREDFWAPGHGPGELDRIFIGLGAAQREEHLVQVPGHQLGEFLAQ